MHCQSPQREIHMSSAVGGDGTYSMLLLDLYAEKVYNVYITVTAHSDGRTKDKIKKVL